MIKQGSSKGQKKCNTSDGNTSSSQGVQTAGDHSSAGNDEPPLASSAEADVTNDTPADINYECCECLGTYKEDAEMGNGAEWVKYTLWSVDLRRLY